jgi:hypothetical protein
MAACAGVQQVPVLGDNVMLIIIIIGWGMIYYQSPGHHHGTVINVLDPILDSEIILKFETTKLKLKIASSV